MADSKSSIGGTGQPITRHPLFPAIVALWCGALAGLGSVTIGSSTVEGLVQMLGIDKVIPMAAPPLGTTMRILLALAMTGLGAAIGGVLARRIAGSARAEAASEQIEDAGAEAVTAAPVEAAPGARRRRALAIEPEAAAPAYDERAPLPGTATQVEPQILNVADFDLDNFDDAPAPAPFRRAFTTVEDTRAAPVAAAPVEDAAEDDNLPAWLEAESAWVEADSTAGQRGVFTTPPGAQVFQPQPAPSDTAAEDDTDSQLGNRLFEAYSRELSPRTETPTGIQPTEDAAPGFEIRFNAAQAAPNQSGFNQPGFKLLPRLPQGDWSAHNDVAEPAAEATAEPGIENEWCEDAALEGTDAFAAPVAEADYAAAPLPEMVDAWAAPVEEIASHEADSTFEAARAEARSAADRIADAELDELSPVELLERLAVAMQRRSEAAREEAARREAQRAEAARLEAARIEAEQEEARRAAQQAAAAAAAPFAAPVVEQAFEEDHADHGFTDSALPDAPAGSSWPAAVPSALRPVELEPIDADDQPLQGYVPPRHIALAPVEETGPEAGFTPNAAFEAIPFPSSPFSGAEVEDDEEAEDDVVLRQGYSSLLNLSRHSAVRKPFLQFGEPDEEGDEEAHATPILPTAYADEDSVEPAPFGRPVLAPAPQPLPQDLSDPAPLAEERPFDAPGRNDPEATERALRAALATLQRMSGAA